jgi:hypothetical protein
VGSLVDNLIIRIGVSKSASNTLGAENTDLKEELRDLQEIV